ncbi:MAG: hypothetical protein JSW53_01285 [Candidatus Bathyarchaeota archaeon]|nr:MAG: hypothetical protein JSW53_01285 [Candidatus Bathyarchaeota archaeon]
MPNGKLLIYTPSSTDRLKAIRSAVSKIAEPLKMQIQVIPMTRTFPAYVYYEREDDSERIPLYCDSQKGFGEREIYQSMRRILFTLSFHPEHSALLAARKELLSPA